LILKKIIKTNPSVSKVSRSNPQADLKPISNKKENKIYTEILSQWPLIVEQKENSIKDRQAILRFLWPTHRLEDLGCINILDGNC
jgi:hypothetical protein